MIDIIIPAYNNHKTIIRTLGSILMQHNVQDVIITIVNDGGESYQEIINIFKPYLNIQEIEYKDNRGPRLCAQLWYGKYS